MWTYLVGTRGPRALSIFPGRTVRALPSNFEPLTSDALARVVQGLRPGSGSVDVHVAVDPRCPDSDWALAFSEVPGATVRVTCRSGPGPSTLWAAAGRPLSLAARPLTLRALRFEFDAEHQDWRDARLLDHIARLGVLQAPGLRELTLSGPALALQAAPLWAPHVESLVVNDLRGPLSAVRVARPLKRLHVRETSEPDRVTVLDGALLSWGCQVVLENTVAVRVRPAASVAWAALSLSVRDVDGLTAGRVHAFESSGPGAAGAGLVSRQVGPIETVRASQKHLLVQRAAWAATALALSTNGYPEGGGTRLLALGPRVCLVDSHHEVALRLALARALSPQDLLQLVTDLRGVADLQWWQKGGLAMPSWHPPDLYVPVATSMMALVQGRHVLGASLPLPVASALVASLLADIQRQRRSLLWSSSGFSPRGQ